MADRHISYPPHIILVIQAIPEASLLGITKRGLIKFTQLLERLVTENVFSGTSSWRHLSTTDIVYK